MGEEILEIITGNIASLLASITDSISATRKTNREVLLVQCISQLFYALGALVLKGYSALVQNIVAVARNLFAASKKSNRLIEWSLVIAAVVLGIIFNNRHLLGFLPVAGNLEYSVAVFRFKDNNRALKTALTLNMIMYAVFNAFIYNFVGAVLNLAVAVTSVVSVVRESQSERHEKETKEE